jgi:ATP-dependent DNA helicase DinG
MKAREALDAMFGDGGVLERDLPGFRRRPQQLEFAHAVLDTIENGGVLIAEAGTGHRQDVRVPRAGAAGRRARHRLHGHEDAAGPALPSDLPRVRQALGASIDVALLKGRANYVCLHHLEAAASRARSPRATTRRTCRRSAASPRSR